MRKPRRRTPLEERFWSRVAKSDGCWLWTGLRNDSGYGLIGRGGRGAGTERTHRLSWIMANGPIPDGLIILHECDTPSCVNPKHLRLGTHMDNTKDKIAKGRMRYGHVPGEKQGLAKLTDQLVRLARAFHVDGISQKNIALAFGVSHSGINAVVSRKTWKHI